MVHRLILSIITICLSLMPVIRAEAQLVAELLTTNSRACESGSFNIVIKFHGSGPFNAELEFTRQNGTLVEQTWISVNDLFDLEDGLFTMTSTVFSRALHGGAARVRLVAARNHLGTVRYPVGVRGEATLFLDEQPTPHAGADQSLCGFTATLSATPSAHSNTFHWVGNGELTFSNVNDPGATITATIANDFTLEFVQTNGACIAQDEVMINLAGSPSGTISTTSEICREGEAQVNITLGGDGPWSLVYTDGATNFPLHGITNNAFSINNQVTGATTFRLLSLTDENGCVASPGGLTGLARVNDLEPNAFAGNNATACGLEFELGATPPAIGSGRWLSHEAGVTFSQVNAHNPVVTVPHHGSRTFTWEVNNQGCIATSQVIVNFIAPPVIAAHLPVSAVCEGESAYLNLNITSPHGPWVVSIQHDGVTRDVNSSIPLFQVPLATGATTTYAITRITDGIGCTTTPHGAVFTLHVDKLPTPFAGPDVDVCGNTVALSATPSPYAGTWSSTAPGMFGEVSNPGTTFTLNALNGTGMAALRWTETNGKCVVHDDVIVTFYQPPLQQDARAGNDMLLYHRFSTFLEAIPPPFGQGEWEIVAGAGTITNRKNPGSEITNLMFGTTLARWTLTNGNCPPVHDEMSIAVEGLKTPTGFSPGNNGKNDTFRIPGAPFITNNEFVVFDHTGMVVYNQRDFEEWNGRDNNGNLVPDGYYFYIFSGDGISPVKSYLVIKRD